MDHEYVPILSICIPTYNRSRLLSVCLSSILEQIKGFEDKIEVVVSDNNSDDDTQSVIESLKELGNFTYHRHSTNIGAGPNFLFLSNKLARGEFCWLIGDDDFVRKGAISRMVSLIEANRDVDLFFTNIMHIEIEKIEHMGEPMTSSKFPDDLRTDSNDLSLRRLNNFDELIDPVISKVYLGALQTSIFRRELWVEGSKDVQVSIDNFANIETTYPHAVILVRQFRDKNVFYVGDPLLVVGDGARDWMWEYPAVHIVRTLELLDYFEYIGMDSKRIRHCRGSLLIEHTPALIVLSIVKVGVGHQYVDYKKVLSKYVGYKEFWLSIPLFLYYRIKYLL